MNLIMMINSLDLIEIWNDDFIFYINDESDIIGDLFTCDFLGFACLVDPDSFGLDFWIFGYLGLDIFRIGFYWIWISICEPN